MSFPRLMDCGNSNIRRCELHMIFCGGAYDMIAGLTTKHHMRKNVFKKMKETEEGFITGSLLCQ